MELINGFINGKMKFIKKKKIVCGINNIFVKFY